MREFDSRPSLIWAAGSAVERFPDKKEVPGPTPGQPTKMDMYIKMLTKYGRDAIRKSMNGVLDKIISIKALFLITLKS